MSRFFWLVALAAACSTAHAAVVCVAAAVPALVRSEGVAERLGDIVLQCSGGAPGETIVNASFTVMLPVNLTNRLVSEGVVDVGFAVETGSGTAVPARLASPASVAFYGVNLTLSPAGAVSVRISNLRGNVSQLGVDSDRTIQAFLSSSLSLTTSSLIVGRTSRGLLAGFHSASISCVGSPEPETLTVSGLFSAGTRPFSVRVTEGSASAFLKQGSPDTVGTRIVLRYSGFPQGARLFVPDVIAGSSALQPTAAGDLGVAASAGRYEPTAAGSLLLARVKFPDPNGVGGQPAYIPGAPGSGAVDLNAASEVSLAAGQGLAAFEVVDSNPAAIESAQIPTFLSFPRVTDGSFPVARMEFSLGPISTAAQASSTAPVPRFLAVEATPDCSGFRDCDERAFPKLGLEYSGFSGPPVQFTVQTGAVQVARYVRIINEGGSTLNWTASAVLKNGTGWLKLFPTSGPERDVLRIEVFPQGVLPGTYEATVTIDGGPFAGTKTLPVIAIITPAPAPPVTPPPVTPPPARQVVMSSVVHAATFAAGPAVPGSLLTLKGTGLSGQNVSVTFDGLPARLLYKSDQQINLEVPPALANRGTAQLVVTVDGVSSTPQTVPLALISPGIFPNAILNQDNTLNSQASTAPAGSIVQIWATGLPDPAVGIVTVRLHDHDVLIPVYAGPAPDIPGVQQVNVMVPDDFDPVVADIAVCGAPLANPAQRTCSPPVKLVIR